MNLRLDAVYAAVNYLAPGGPKPFSYTFEPPPGKPWRSGVRDERRVRIANARVLEATPVLEREGFALVPHDTDVTDFYDEDEVRSVYYPEVEALLKRETGASLVIIFDHTRRSNDPAQRKAVEKLREPVLSVHNDYSELSGRRRVYDHLPKEEAERRLRGRHAIINVWRPVRGPVEESPLAVADAQSVNPADLVATDLIYPDKIGETYGVAYNPGHRWFYYPDLRPDEAILIKSFDSSSDGRSRFTPHTAFADPASRTSPKPRESIEVRALVFFGD
ncbi:hypothetical protein sos41_41610 [Alphaproteobacteria bacterium SO-S41]|nr:hypothetical protein sos41_41610 [Alphaproteobacteria bacterium SO-S41]